MNEIINLIIQVVAGIAGGNAVGKGMQNFDLGPLGNTVAGAIGGGAGGQILQAPIPMLAGASGGGLDLGSIIGQVVGGGASGAILTAVIALLKNTMSGKKA